MEDLLLNKSYDEKDLERTSNVKNHLDDIYTLEDMGFNSIFIKKIYAFLRPQNIENAMTLMTKENGKYLHDFRQGNKIMYAFFVGKQKIFIKMKKQMMMMIIEKMKIIIFILIFLKIIK